MNNLFLSKVYSQYITCHQIKKQITFFPLAPSTISFLTVRDSPERRWPGCGWGSVSAVGRPPERPPAPPGSWWRYRTGRGAPGPGALAAVAADTPGGCVAGWGLCTWFPGGRASDTYCPGHDCGNNWKYEKGKEAIKTSDPTQGFTALL